MLNSRTSLLKRSIGALAITWAAGSAACTPDSPGALATEIALPVAAEIVLAYQPDPEDPLDARIAEQQSKLREHKHILETLDRLGRLFVGKARITSDPGFYELTSQCGQAIVDLQPEDCAAGRFLEALVAHSLHRFSDAEVAARSLVSERGDFEDHGLLGDVLLDRGDVEGAFSAYQAMLDLKPCLQSYARAARVLWIRNDLDGARQLLDLAATAGSLRDPEALAWVHTERAQLALVLGDAAAASSAADNALRVVEDYPPALLAMGRVHVAAGSLDRAEQAFEKAASQRDEPAYVWALEDTLRSLGKTKEADDLAQRLETRGARDDGRTFALYLATQSRDTDRAARVARAELQVRADIHTHDAVAWSLLRTGDIAGAERAMRLALQHDTPDPRLWLHAGAIAAASGDTERARSFLVRAQDAQLALWPSERRILADELARI